MTVIRFHVEAETELRKAIEFYDAQLSGLGNALLVEVRKAVQLIEAYPDAGQPISTRLRKYALRRFPFSLIYQAHAKSILIVAVAHHRRRPGYWRAR